MNQLAPSTSRVKVDQNPYVSRLAGRLVETATNADLRFDSDGWQLISEMLSYAASAEQRLSAQRERIAQLEIMSVTDELTGLNNRRGLERFLSNALSAAARHGDDGVVGYIDLDGFKAINDTLGHAAGDSILQRLAKELQYHVRPTDMVARLCGDEFAVVITRCDAVEGMIRLKHLQETLNNMDVEVGGMSVKLNISLGMAPYSGASKIDLLLNQADQEMYANKAKRKAKFN